MLMLTLDDAVKVTKQLVIDGMDDDVIIRQELEQKCWLPPKKNKSANILHDTIFDINPAEICKQIEEDNLKEWCKSMQVAMLIAMVYMPCWEEGEENE